MTPSVVSTTKILKQLYSLENINAGWACSDADSRIWAMWRRGEINYHDYSTLNGRLAAAQRNYYGTALEAWVAKFVKRFKLSAYNIFDLMTKPKRAVR